MQRPAGMSFEEYRRLLTEYNIAMKRRAKYGIILANDDDRVPATKAELQRRQLEVVKRIQKAKDKDKNRNQ